MVEMLSSLNIARNRRVLKSRILSKFVFLVKTARFPGKGTTTTGPPANAHLCGAVNRSSSVRLASASSRQEPHISGDGCREPHTAGRSGAPKIRQRNSESRFTHGTPVSPPASPESVTKSKGQCSRRRTRDDRLNPFSQRLSANEFRQPGRRQRAQPPGAPPLRAFSRGNPG